jgi:Protein of unknown function (DUF3108)
MILNTFFKYLLVGLSAGAMALPCLARAALLSAATITYNLSLNGVMLGTITEHFEIRDGQYRASSEARATGLLALVQRDPARYVSTGTVTRDGLRPQRFEGQHRGKSLSADFDWAAKKLTLIHDGLNHALDLPAGAQDRLSIMYHLMFAVRDKPSRLEVNITNGRKLTHYRYAVKDEVTIDTPFKRLNTVHFVKQREPGESGTEVWISPEHAHLPVKVLIIEDDGDRFEQVATRVDIKP